MLSNSILFSVKKFISLFLLLSLSLTISAKNIGVIGQTYPIGEEDFLQAIKNKMQQKIQTGEWAQWQTQQTANLQNSVDRPAPVNGLTPATETRSWFYDPAISIPYDIVDAQNNLISAAGSSFNPLDTIAWKAALIFYDGDNPQQVTWVKQMDQQLKGQDKLILINGSVSQQTQQFQKRIYFDQGGQLVNRLKIAHTPALVVQEGQQLKITEFKL